MIPFVTTDEQVGSVQTCLTRWGAARAASKWNANTWFVTYQPVRRCLLAWDVVAFQRVAVPNG